MNSMLHSGKEITYGWTELKMIYLTVIIPSWKRSLDKQNQSTATQHLHKWLNKEYDL